ncbi:hypothetical protein EJ06DRAFT_528351 [Trichodelitschia bisporula]|uniref:Uncharacterized protein n=1 Tax=Trichodelitschia bisporula TaxID=703511 RepID=A0A6G1I2E6_9PEZI|nr:hypothetical protein EJ06DRAFT_528351 [Trichodelitschia bisporula]
MSAALIAPFPPSLPAGARNHTPMFRFTASTSALDALSPTSLVSHISLTPPIVDAQSRDIPTPRPIPNPLPSSFTPTSQLTAHHNPDALVTHPPYSQLGDREPSQNTLAPMTPSSP